MNQALFQALRSRGVYREPAAEIAAIYEDDQTDIVLTAFDQHILDTNGNMSIAVWRIKQQILAPGFQWGISNLQRIAREMGLLSKAEHPNSERIHSHA